MREEDFFITDNLGRRQYLGDIQRRRKAQAAMRKYRVPSVAVTLVGGALIVMCAIWQNETTHIAGVLVTVMGLIAMVVVFGKIHADGVVAQWDQEWAYLQEDRKRAALGAPEPKTVRAQQPQGASADEGTI